MNQRLRRLRVDGSFSQKYIAECLGISQSAYSQIEKGTVALSVDHLKTLSKKYNVSLDWLAWGQGPKHSYLRDNYFIPLVRTHHLNEYFDNIGQSDFLDNLPHCKVPGYSGKQCRIFEIPGEALKPHLFPGDYTICSRVIDHDAVNEGSFFVVVNDNTLEVKRYHAGNHSNGSMNGFFENCRELWKVEAKLSTVLVSTSEDQEKRISNLEQEFMQVKQQLNQTLQLIDSNTD